MAEVLLTHSNHLWSDRKQIAKMQPYPPLQTMIAAAVLRDSGIEVALFDPQLEPSIVSVMKGFEAILDADRPRLAVVCEDDFNFLSKMCLTKNRELAFRFAAAACARGVAVAAHGSDASDHTDAYLRAGFSYVIVGEVEQTLLELAQGQMPEQIRGLAFHGPFGTARTAPRPPLASVDVLPAAAWDMIDADHYRSAWQRAHGYFSLNLVSSRGCPYRCNWCAKPIYGQQYRCRSARLVAREMLDLKQAFHPDQLWFADDIFALSPRWTLEFASAVRELDASIPFRMQSRCDLMTRDTVAALRDAGCVEVWMGAESGSQKILDAMEKNIRVHQIYEARENLGRHGIRACFFLQFGYPGEDWPEVEATIRMIRQTRPDDIGVSVSYPLPGTRFHQNVAAEMGPRANWTDSADLAMMFHGSYTTDFYRALADALHREVRGREGVDEAWRRVYELESHSLIREAIAS